MAHHILDNNERKSNTHACYVVNDHSPHFINNSTWVQFNISAVAAGGHTRVYTVKLTLTETP